MILLDTNAVIGLMKGHPASIRPRLNQAVAAGTKVAMSSIVLFELHYGIARSERKTENTSRLNIFLEGPIAIEFFDSEDAAAAGVVRAALAAHGTPIGPYDVLIAGQALRHKATLVTANTREFKRVKGLKVEDWGR